MKKILISTFGLFGIYTAAHAQTTDTFTVSVDVQGACAIAADDLDFGTYSPAVADSTLGQSDMTVNCTLNVPYSVGLDGGTTSGDVTDREMTDGTTNLNYNLYTAADLQTVVTDIGGAAPFSGVGSGADQTITVYGQIPAQQSVPTGAYADTITATISF